MEDCRLDNAQVLAASKALLQHVEGAKSKNDLFAEDADVVSVILAMKKIPQRNKTKPVRIEIPNSLHRGAGDICLICKDPQREYKDLLAAKKVDGITKVIGVTKLKQNYVTYENKRELSNSYSLFLADDRVIPMLPKLLGKAFFRKKKQPLPVNLKKDKLKREIDTARDSTFMYFGDGSCCSVKIGRTTFTPKQLQNNIMQGVQNMVSNLPRQWNNVLAIHIKTNDSIALPVYNALPAGERTDE